MTGTPLRPARAQSKDRGDLGDADARHHPRGADRPGPMPTFMRVDAGLDQGVGGLGGGDVARR